MRAKSAWMLAAAIIWTTTGSGCAAPPPRVVTEPLPLPARPVLPRLTAADLECITDDAYRRLVARDRQRREYAETLEVIIQATHGAD